MYNRRQTITGSMALKIIDSLLADLGQIDPSDLTTFELNVLRRCAENAPKIRRGREEEIAYTDRPKE